MISFTCLQEEQEDVEAGMSLKCGMLECLEAGMSKKAANQGKSASITSKSTSSFDDLNKVNFEDRDFGDYVDIDDRLPIYRSETPPPYPPVQQVQSKFAQCQDLSECFPPLLIPTLLFILLFSLAYYFCWELSRVS